MAATLSDEPVEQLGVPVDPQEIRVLAGDEGVAPTGLALAARVGGLAPLAVGPLLLAASHAVEQDGHRGAELGVLNQGNLFIGNWKYQSIMVPPCRMVPPLQCKGSCIPSDQLLKLGWCQKPHTR